MRRLLGLDTDFGPSYVSFTVPETVIPYILRITRIFRTGPIVRACQSSIAAGSIDGIAQRFAVAVVRLRATINTSLIRDLRPTKALENIAPVSYTRKSPARLSGSCCSGRNAFIALYPIVVGRTSGTRVISCATNRDWMCGCKITYLSKSISPRIIDSRGNHVY